MKISYSGASTFWSNPEKYRIQYPHNLEPIGKAYGLQRGSALHCKIQSEFHRLDYQALLEENEVTDVEAVAVALLMYDAWKDKRRERVRKVIDCEMEVMVPLENGHVLHNIPDEVLIDYGNRLMCGQTKSAWKGAKYDQLQADWDVNLQVNCDLLGLQHLGHKTYFYLVTTVIEREPLEVWFTSTYRTKVQLEMTKRWLSMICDTIEMYTEKYGIEQPWPHTRWLDKWCRNDCAYSELCERNSREWDTSMFKERRRRS